MTIDPSLHTIQENISLLPYNTFRIDCRAKYFAKFSSQQELSSFLSFSYEKLLLLGGGSNILFTQNFDGLVLKNEMKGIEKIAEDDDFIYVKAGAGENWHQFVLSCISNGWAGVENLSLIPGCVGASPMQNIGAYGVEIKDVFHTLTAFHVADKQEVVFSLADCEFAYRESVFKRKFKNQFVITSVTYRLRKTPVFTTSYGAIEKELQAMGVQELSITAVAKAVIHIRSSKLPDPVVIGNAGSFFKNPSVPKEMFEKLKEEFPAIVGYDNQDGTTKLAAGWLIEQAGWKGYRSGYAGVHTQQALVLVNYGKAHGEEILKLSERIIESIRKKFGVVLEREVNLV